MPVLINGTALVPAPLMSVSYQKDSAPDGTNLSGTYQITLKGNLIAAPPGGGAVNADARLGVLLAKQQQLKTLFNTNGRTLEVYSPDGSNVVKCNPRLLSIDFAEGIWVDRTEYTIVLESHTLYPNDTLSGLFVTDLNDQWDIEEAGFTTEDGDPDMKPMWQITHTVSAKGQLVYDENGNIDTDLVPWKRARDWVVARLAVSDFDTRPFDTVSELNIIDGMQPYNHVRTESVDKINGVFSIKESWLVAYGSQASEDYSISVKNTPEDSVLNSVTITGTIRGFAAGTNNLHQRMSNAVNYFENSVKANLFTRASNVLPGVTLSAYGSTASLDYNYAEGYISYTYEFNDRPTNGSGTVYDTYTVTKTTSIEEAEIKVAVSGTIIGRLQLGEPNASLLKFERAKTYWDALLAGGGIFTRANASGVANLKSAPISNNVEFNYFEGSLNYTYEYNNRSDQSARHEYSVNIKTSREEGRVIVSVDGTITGLRQNENDPNSVRYANAKAFWTAWQSQIRPKASSFVPGITLNTVPASTSVGHNERNGVINYTYEYNTDASPTIPGALSEQISITDGNPSDVFAVIPVLGRLAGPVLQNIGSKKEKTRTITLDVVMAPGEAKPNTNGVMAAYRPAGSKVYLDRDEESWVPNLGKYARNMSYVYE